MKKAWALFLFCLSLNAFSVSHYYPQAFKEAFRNHDLKDEELKEGLFKVLTMKHIKRHNSDDQLAYSCRDASGKCYSQRSLSYRDARKVMFGVVHREEDRNGSYVRDVYCGKVVRISKNPIPNHTIMNTEHTWPQSRFNTRFPRNVQKTDIHHLYPTDSRANSDRGSFPFADVNGRELSGCEGSYLGSADGRGNFFEPPNEHKGNVARALFYFSIRYQSKISKTEERALRRWHELDPVDDEERARNDKIFEVQGNRNPFIDYPSLVSDISNF